MTAVFTLISFIFGSIIGSFINAYTFRYNTGMSMTSRSRCLSCSTTIAWYDLVPGLSFLILRGKCRNCNSKFSIQYPLVEILTGVLFAGLFWTLGATIESFLIAIIFSILIAIIIYDIRHTIIPDVLVYWFIFLSLVSIFILDNVISSLFFNWTHIWTALSLFLFFFLIWFFSKGTWMGLGDAKLALGMGFLLGVSSISAVILGFWIGAIVSILILIVQRLIGKKDLTMKSEIPFALFLIIGLWIVFFFGSNVLNIGI